MEQEEIDNPEIWEINDFTQIASITGDENLPVQTPAGTNLSCSIAQIAGYALPATCGTADNTATKEVVITGYHGTVLPQLVAVTFTNGNAYGDITASPATHPYIQFKNADGVNLGNAKDLCDCLGNYAGTGCIGSGNIIILRTIGNKTLITNSDIRQKTATYTIQADGNKDYKAKTINFTGTTNSAGNVTLPATVGTSTIIGIYILYADVTLYTKIVRNGGQNYWSLQVTNKEGSPITDKAISGTIVYIDL